MKLKKNALAKREPKCKMKISVYIFLLLLPFTLLSRKEANIWYFGNNAGLDFNGGQPVAILDGKLNSNEGCATLSDRNGKLLFYTDGVTVWNREHRVLPNGTGLMGHNSSTQSAVIVPVPESENLFYIFTVDDKDRSGGFRYSLLDLNLDNGFGGIVDTIKNKLLFAPSAEKISAVNNYDCSGVWVVSHEWGNNAFRAYLVSSSGIDTIPVISNVGIKYEGSVHNKKGYLKSNTFGTKIAAASGYTSTIELFDFDNRTGVLSNNVKLEYSDWEAYGVEFSPDGKKLYATLNTRSIWFWSENELWQFTIESGIPTQITGSRRTVATQSLSSQFGALQLATNGKIYVARQDAGYVGVINKPDEALNNCNYVSNGVNLGGRSCVWGLPFFIQSFFYNSSFVSLPQIKAKVDTRNLPVRLTANLNCGNTDTLKVGFEATIELDARVFYVRSIEKCNLKSMSISGEGKMTLKVFADSLLITSVSKDLAVLKGDILLGSEADSTILDIVDFAWTGSNINIEKSNGKILTYGVCVQDLRRLNKISKESLIIQPNPAEDFLEIEVRSAGFGKCELAIYNQQGEKKWSTAWSDNSGLTDTKSFNPVISDLSSGIYLVRLVTPLNCLLEKIIIY